MINLSKYFGDFAADFADDYASMMGSLNYSAAADDVHVSTISTATLGDSDDVNKNVAADYVHISTVRKATLGGSDVGYPMTHTNSCASIDIEIGQINWSFDHDRAGWCWY